MLCVVVPLMFGPHHGNKRFFRLYCIIGPDVILVCRQFWHAASFGCRCKFGLPEIMRIWNEFKMDQHQYLNTGFGAAISKTWSWLAVCTVCTWKDHLELRAFTCGITFAVFEEWNNSFPPHQPHVTTSFHCWRAGAGNLDSVSSGSSHGLERPVLQLK